MSEAENLELTGAQGVPTSITSAPAPVEMLPTVNADLIPTILGREPLVPGDYVFAIKGIAFDDAKRAQLNINLQMVRPLSLVDGAPTPTTGFITDRLGQFRPPTSGAADNIKKQYQISFGRFKGLYQHVTGNAITGQFGQAEFEAAVAALLNQQVVARIAWTLPSEVKGEKPKRITYSDYLVKNKPRVYDNVTSYRALKDTEKTSG